MGISPYPPKPVRFPVMHQNWEALTFLHWRYDPEIVRRTIPDGLELDTFDGSAWVGLIPFRITGMRAPFIPALPWLSAFPETNVRTYVKGPGGHHGVWFYSLDASRLAAVAGARLTYGLPYIWSRMDVRSGDARVQYSARRRGGRQNRGYSIAAAPGPRFDPGELTDLDHFLTARFRLYTVIAGQLAYAPIEHPPWPLARVRVDSLEENIVEAADIPPPSGNLLAHYSAFISVRIGSPRLVL